jgi:hypothetical protein
MTKFKKGEDPRRNTAGRPKGSANRTSEEIRSMIGQFLSDNLGDLQTDFDRLDAYQRLTLFDRLVKHILPPPLDPIERLSDDQFKKLKTELIEWMQSNRHGTEQKTTPSTANGSNAGE